MGIRVPDAQYEAPTPTPEMAEVPVAKQPVANANMFGADQAEAGEQAGAKVEGAAVDIADRIIQQKMWTQQSEIYQNKENVRDAQTQLLYDDGTHEVKDPDGTVRQVANGLALRTGQDAVGVAQEYQTKMAGIMQSQRPDGLLNSLNKTWERNVGSVYSLGYNKIVGYESAQKKQTVINNFTDAYSSALKNSPDSPTFHEALNQTNEINHNLQAALGSTPKDMLTKQNENAYNTGVQYFTSKIATGQLTGPQALQDLETSKAQGGVGTVLTSDDEGRLITKINESYDAYTTEQNKQQARQTAQNTNDTVAKVGAGVINAKNANSIFQMGLDPKISEPLYNAIMNVNSQKIASINKGGTMNDNLPLNEKSLGQINMSGQSGQEAKDAAKYALGIANSMTHQDATEALTKAITSDKLDKAQLEVYTRTLALVGQYLPTKEEAAQGSPMNPQGTAQVGGLKDITTWGNKVGATDLTHIGQYLDNNDKKMNPTDNIAAVKQNFMNNRFPNTVGSGKTPNIVVDRGGSQRYFMQKVTDSSAYPFMYDEGSKMVIPNKDYKQARPSASQEK